MALNQDKYDLKVRNQYAIKRNGIFFYLMQRAFNRMDGLYLRERYLLIYANVKYQWRKQSAAEVENLKRGKKGNKQNKGRYI